MVGRISSAAFVLAMLAGCSTFVAEDGQFLCDVDQRCPSGQRCVVGVCQIGAAADGGPPDGNQPDGTLDSGANLDAGLDGLGPDAVVVPELCPPDETTGFALDEDEDGRFDEGCEGWFFGTPHLVEHVNANRAVNTYGLAIGGDAHRGYVPTTPLGSSVRLVVRADVSQPFASNGEAVPGAKIDDGRIVAVTVNAAETLLVAQTDSGLKAFTRGLITDAFMLDEEFDLDAEGVHPALSPDGLHLYYATGSPRTVHRATRSSDDARFGFGEPLSSLPSPSSWPRVSADGALLFYTGDGISVTEVHADAGSIGPGTSLKAELLDFNYPMYLPREREMWLVAGPSREWSPAPSTVWRVQVCRGQECAPEPELGCPSKSQSLDGFSCYQATTMPFTWGGAGGNCVAPFALASIASEDEQQHIAGGFRSHWIGLSRLNPAPLEDGARFSWINGEPRLYTADIDIETAANHDCVSLTAAAAWENIACAERRLGVCERRVLPTWTSP